MNDLEGCIVSSRARRFYCEKYLPNLRPIFSLFIYSVAIYNYRVVTLLVTIIRLEKAETYGDAGGVG